MKRNIHFTLVLLVLLFTPIMPIFSETVSPLKLETKARKSFFKDINFTIGTGLSYLSGQYREIVYPDTTSVNPYLSELLWNLDNIFLLNFTTGVRKGSWALDLALSTAITSQTGNMTDTDWLDSASTDRTHWSLSKIWLDNSFIFETGIKYNFNLTRHISFPIGMGYKLNFWDWEDKVLDFIYPDPQPPDFIGENGIDYKVIQNIFYASSGILFKWGSIATGLNFAISPLIYAWDLDHHILRKKAPYFFHDTFLATFWYRTELSVKTKIRSNEGLMFTIFLEELPETVGDTYYFDKNPSDPEEIGTQTGYYEDGAGLASFTWGIKLSYTWTF